MAKKIARNSLIKTADDLVTSREQTRAGFIAMALEKNYIAVPYIEEARALKALARKIKKPIDLLEERDIRIALLAASGLSDKSLHYLSEGDKTHAIKELIKKFLEPAGENFIDELVYRYLLIKGDALGGKARNLAGTLGERKFLRTLLSVLNLAGIPYKWRDCETKSWVERGDNDLDIEKRLNALQWDREGKSRLLVMNISVPTVKKNVDLSVIEGDASSLKKGATSIIHQANKFLALGELKGGIDPAGADEHWKTANSALIRIRNSFKTLEFTPKTFFIGAAIEKSMANEMFAELQNGVLSNAANLTHDRQMTEICNWIMHL